MSCPYSCCLISLSSHFQPLRELCIFGLLSEIREQTGRDKEEEGWCFKGEVPGLPAGVAYVNAA